MKVLVTGLLLSACHLASSDPESDVTVHDPEKLRNEWPRSRLHRSKMLQKSLERQAELVCPDAKTAQDVPTYRIVSAQKDGRAQRSFQRAFKCGDLQCEETNDYSRLENACNSALLTTFNPSASDLTYDNRNRPIVFNGQELRFRGSRFELSLWKRVLELFPHSKSPLYEVPWILFNHEAAEWFPEMHDSTFANQFAACIGYWDCRYYFPYISMDEDVAPLPDDPSICPNCESGANVPRFHKAMIDPKAQVERASKFLDAELGFPGLSLPSNDIAPHRTRI